MKAPNRFEIIITGDVDQVRSIPISSWSGLNYLLARLLKGEEVADSEWAHYGLRVSVGDDMDGGPEG